MDEQCYLIHQSILPSATSYCYFHILCICHALYFLTFIFTLHAPCFPFFLIDHNRQQVLLINWVIFFLKLWNIFALSKFLKKVIFKTLFRRWSTLWNSMLKITTFVSTLSNVVTINVEVDNINSMLFNVASFNVDLTLSDVATSHHASSNVETTLKCFLSIEECCLIL